ATMMMVMGKSDSAIETSAKSRTVAVVRIIGRDIRRAAVFHINPGLSGLAAHFAGCLLCGRAPREPNRVHRHAGTDLPLPNQRLIARRKRVEHVLMFGDPILRRFAAR